VKEFKGQIIVIRMTLLMTLQTVMNTIYIFNENRTGFTSNCALFSSFLVSDV